MEEEKIEEQQSSLETETTRSDSSSSVEIEIPQQASETQKGEPIGKFKSADDLLTAYNNLEKEFTKKSQRLAQLEKEKAPNEQTENGLKAFLSKTAEAFSYADELKARVAKEPTQDEAAFAKVWNEILYEKLSGKADFKKMILNDDEVKDLVIINYLKALSKQQNPIVMSTNSGVGVTKVATPKPDSFEQAKNVVLDLLS